MTKPPEEASTICGLACEPRLGKGNLLAKEGLMYIVDNKLLTAEIEPRGSAPGENHCSFERRM